MISTVKRYLAVRRATGFELMNTEYLLRSFACWAGRRGERYVRTESAIAWANQTVSVAQRDARLKTICRFARYLRAEDNRHELPPVNHFGYCKRRRVPHIYSAAEIRRLLDAALQLGPPDSLQPHTYTTLIGLLSVTGLRISEALALRVFRRHTPGAADPKNEVPKDAFAAHPRHYSRSPRSLPDPPARALRRGTLVHS